MERSWIWYGIAYLVVFGTQYIYSEPLLKWSAETIPVLQDRMANSINFFHYYTNIGGGLTQALFFFIMAFFRIEAHYFECVVLASALSLELFLVSALKVFHHQDRPFWINDDIDPDSCSVEFGNPSGHALCAIYFSLYLSTVILQTGHTPLSKDSLAYTSQESPSAVFRILRYLQAGVILTGALFIVYSRFLLGMHSLAQLIYGSLLGAVTCWIVTTKFRPIIHSIADQGEMIIYYAIPSFILFLITVGIVLFADWQIWFELGPTQKAAMDKCEGHAEDINATFIEK